MFERLSLEHDGFKLLSVDKLPGVRRWWYAHISGTKMCVELDLVALRLRMFNRSKLVKEVI